MVQLTAELELALIYLNSNAPVDIPERHSLQYPIVYYLYCKGAYGITDFDEPIGRTGSKNK